VTVSSTLGGQLQWPARRRHDHRWLPTKTANR
jgi:hypothetical protein